jgi:hypothetical protein
MKISAVALGLCAALVFAAPAQASGCAAKRDRADNVYWFGYEGGEVTEAGSSILLTPGPHRVDFRTALATPKDGSLTGMIVLRLNGAERRVYDGSFTLTLRSSGGDKIVASKDDRIVLRPTAGHRRAEVLIDLDAPSGDYTMEGSFRS